MRRLSRKSYNTGLWSDDDQEMVRIPPVPRRLGLPVPETDTGISFQTSIRSGTVRRLPFAFTGK